MNFAELELNSEPRCNSEVLSALHNSSNFRTELFQQFLHHCTLQAFRWRSA